MFLRLDTKIKLNAEVASAPNLCDRFTERDLQQIGGLVWEGYSRDEYSRSTYMKRAQAAMDLALQIQKDKAFPWPGCANIVFPLITIAALQFSARSYSNLIQGTDPVKYRVPAEDKTGELQLQALRMSRHMSWQVLEEDVSWEEQHDRLLINLCIVGTNFIKTYYSPSKGYSVSDLVLAQDFVLDYYAKSVEECSRKTHIIPLYRNSMYANCKSGIFVDVTDKGWFTSSQPIVTPEQTKQNNGQVPSQSDEDTPFRTLEQHRYLDLDGDGYAEPYIVTIDANSKQTLRMVARWNREEDIERNAKKEIIRIKAEEYFTKYSFLPSPDGGIYDIGFGTLLGPLNESVNTGINQLLDAGTMANSTGGFLGRGAKIRGGVYTMAPWEWKRVDSTGDDLRKSLIPLPVKEPSTVLFNLLNLLISYTDRVSGATDVMVGENPGQNTPAETSRNMVEQGMQIYSTIFKRVWRSMKEEFKKRHKLNAMFLPLKQPFGSKGNFVLREDYKMSPDMVVPSADPAVTSKTMRLTQAQGIRQAAMTTPGYNIKVVEQNYLRALGVDEVDLFYPGPDKVPPGKDIKLQIQEMKSQEHVLKLKWEQQKFVVTLMQDRELNRAMIDKLRTEAAATLAGIDATKAATALSHFEAIVGALETRNDMISRQIEAMQSGEGNAASQNPNGGGVSGMEAAPGNAGVSGGDGGVSGGNEVPMGEGNV